MKDDPNGSFPDLPDAVHPVLVVNEAAETTFTLDARVVKDSAYNEAATA